MNGGEAGDSPRFAETIAGMQPDGSPSETTARYALVSNSPIAEMDRDDFMVGGRDSSLIIQRLQGAFGKMLENAL
ncbi:hypothetical protein [Bradyrhizobium sp. CCBAU 51627]|uniref:hypothetical protein n=1 Tax=Bradyrhizobium sp. CCBAU 51627 TaxID=1325088 RepID=UPI0023050C22|nr:hypothetical protein [Bradyrhizobium sp. CCBAU 51627]